jgi:hypothetical protein
MDSSFAGSSADPAGNDALETPRWLPWLWALLVLAGTLTYGLAARLGDRKAGVKALLVWWRAVLGL